MRWAGDNRLTVAIVALAVMSSAGQPADDSAIVLTVPLHLLQAGESSSPSASISADGRFVAFVSFAPLVAADTNDQADVYVLDRGSGALSLERVAATPNLQERPLLSPTGHYLVYEADAGEGSAAVRVIMIGERPSGAARPLQRGAETPNGSSRSASISADERYVAFASSATNLVEGADANGRAEDVYVADLASGSVRRASTDSSGVQASAGSSFAPSISDDGRFIAFTSSARLDPATGDPTVAALNIYVKDLLTGVTTRGSVGEGGRAVDGASYSPAISGDGRYLAFVSEATNLVKKHNGSATPNVYVRDLATNVTELISRTPSGHAGNGPSGHPSISADGRIVVFQSDASDLTCGERCALDDRDINLVTDIFLFDRIRGQTARISRGRLPWMEPSIGPAMDRSGDVIAFASRHPLDERDDRHDYDLFVWARRVSR